MKKYLIKSATLVNEGRSYVADVLINGKRIERIDNSYTRFI